MTTSRSELTELLRRRLQAGLRDGTLGHGSRLTSTRDLARQLEVDPRLVLAAYRELAREGVVELRPRSGIYLAARTDSDGAPVPPAEWLADVLGDAVERDVAAPDLARWLQRAVETLRLRAVVIAGTADQTVGICAELRGLYGLQADGLRADGMQTGGPRGPGTPTEDGGATDAGTLERLLAGGERLPAALARADLVVGTPGSAELAGALAARLEVPLVLADVRPDLLGAQWRRLLQPVFVLVADERFGQMVRAFVDGVPGAEQLTVLVAGRDDVARIPADAPVYLTRAAQERLGDVPLPGRRVPPARIFTAEASRAILRWLVSTNLAAAQAQRSAAVIAPAGSATAAAAAGAAAGRAR